MNAPEAQLGAAAAPPGRVVLAGGKGFLGGLLAAFLEPLGFEPVVLTRHPDRGARHLEVAWDAKSQGEWSEVIDGCHTVINLAGRSVDCRYTKNNQREIMDSRVKSTLALGEAIAKCVRPPRNWFNSSTATIYKHTMGKPNDENSNEFFPSPEAKDKFSVEVALAWEEAFHRIPTTGTRKIALRTTMVLGHDKNSVFPVLMRLARFGLGGTMGSGNQFVSWIHRHDFCQAIYWLMINQQLNGPVNLAAPHPLTNREMMQTVRKAARFPFGLPAPEFLLELGAFFLRTETELILKSRRVISSKLDQSGFRFAFPTFDEAVQDLLRQPNS